MMKCQQNLIKPGKYALSLLLHLLNSTIVSQPDAWGGGGFKREEN